MKNIIKATIAILVFLMIALTSILSYALVRGMGEVPIIGTLTGRFIESRLINTQTVDISDITDIDIQSNSSDIYFKRSDGEELVVKEYIGGQADKRSHLTVSKSGERVKIEMERKRVNSWVVFGSTHRYIEVYLPASYHADLMVNTSSGDISTEIDFRLADCTVSTSSGYTRLQNITADTMSIKTSSGDIYAEQMNGQKQLKTSSGDIMIAAGEGTADVSTSSGDINLGAMAGKIDIDTSSGYVKIDTLDGDGRIKTSSGDVYLDVSSLNSSLTVNCSSGEVYCKLPSNIRFKFAADTSSGDIVTDFDQDLSFNRKGTEASGTVGGYADTAVTISTTSGDIQVNYR